MSLESKRGGGGGVLSSSLHQSICLYCVGCMKLLYLSRNVSFDVHVRVFLISFHLDHCGALPWFLQKTSFKGRTFMTHATKAIYRWLLSDYVKVR